MLVNPFIKIYNGYGTPNKLFLLGHVLKRETRYRPAVRNSYWSNIKTLVQLFNVRTVSGVPLRLEWEGQKFYTTSEFDGFFRFEITLDQSIGSGWHEADVYADGMGAAVPARGRIYLPPSPSYAVVSDIDDTIIKSYSTSTLKKLLELLRRNADKRKTFEMMSEFFQQFKSDTAPVPYTFFYVSSSEWNLYDYIKQIFRKNNLPEGVFLLNTIKKVKDLAATGYTGHEGKFFRIARLFISFPEMRFLLIGDNSQKDVSIYSAIAQKYPEQILGILIRNVRSSKKIAAEIELNKLEELGVRCYQFRDTAEAKEKCRDWGLI